MGQIQDRTAAALRAGEGAGRMNESDILDRAGRFLRERKRAEEELICTVCTEWGTDLEEFARYLGKATLSSFVSAPPLLPVVSVSSPFISPLIADLAKSRSRVERSHVFLISYSRDRKVARLHLAAKGCFWANSELKDCELFDAVDPSLYNARGKFCFPQLTETVEAEGESNSDSTGSEEGD